jgi:HNH endonuclease
MQIEITEDYLASQGLSVDFPERFWAKVNKTATCWLWTGYIEHGYGALTPFRGSRKLIDAHRASYILHKGPIPPGLDVLHNCPGGDIPWCVHPDHLWLGNQRQNVLDCVKKKRHAFGERNGQHKLTRQEANAIRALYKGGTLTQRDLAAMFGICLSQINCIIHYRSWFH